MERRKGLLPIQLSLSTLKKNKNTDLAGTPSLRKRERGREGEGGRQFIFTGHQEQTYHNSQDRTSDQDQTTRRIKWCPQGKVDDQHLLEEVAAQCQVKREQEGE